MLLSILFFIFPFNSKSKFIPYTETDLQKALQKSYLKPVFILLYDNHCDACCGLPERVQSFANTTKFTDQVKFFTIDCSTSYTCIAFPIVGTPTFYFIRSPHKSLWQEIYCRKEECWETFLENEMTPAITETNKKPTEIVQNSKMTKDGSIFYYSTNSAEDDVIKILTRLSVTYKFINASIYYHVNENLKENQRKLTAYQKKNCPISFNIEPFENKTFNKKALLSFIDQHKYSPFHQYQYNEVSELPKETLFTYYFTLSNLTDAEIYNYEQMTSNECSDVVYGLTSKQNQPEFMRHSKLTLIDLPALVTVDKLKKCTHVWKKGLNNYKEHYLPNILKRKCIKEEIKRPVKFPSATVVSLIILSVLLFFKNRRPKK